MSEKDARAAMGYYKLDASAEPVKVASADEWATWRKGSDTVVARDTVNGLVVETFFRGYDHTVLTDQGYQPELWRTRIVDCPDNVAVSQRRFRSKAEALTGHAICLAAVGALKQ